MLNRREVDEWTRNIWNREHIDLENDWEVGGHRCVLVNKFCQSIPLPSSADSRMMVSIAESPRSILNPPPLVTSNLPGYVRFFCNPRALIGFTGKSRTK